MNDRDPANRYLVSTFALTHCTLITLKISGSVTYNGHVLKEFVPQRTSAYVSQQDWHAAEMTVRETLEFAGRCQGVGTKYGKLWEIRYLCTSGACLDADMKTLSQICY